MSTTQRVSDEVWRSVPAKTLPAGRVWTAVAVMAALILVAAWAAQSGRIVPHLVVGSSGASAKADSGRFEYRFDVTNEGAVDVEVVGVRLDADWLSIRSMDYGGGGLLDGFLQNGVVDVPFTIPAATTVPVRLEVLVDCDARTGEGVPVVLEARALLGTHDVAHQPMGSAPMVDSYSMTEQPWPVATSDWVCTPYTGEMLDE